MSLTFVDLKLFYSLKDDTAALSDTLVIARLLFGSIFWYLYVYVQVIYMYICICICVYVYVYVPVYTYIYIYILFVCMCIMYTCVNICVFTCY